MTLSAVAQRWAGSRDLPAHHLGVRGKRDRLSDLEAGTLGELAFEDEHPSPEACKMMTVTIKRQAGDAAVGVELDVCARQAAQAAEVVVGAVTSRSPADGVLRAGDSIRKVNGAPCCTIEDVRREVDTALALTFEISRPRDAALHVGDAMVQAADGSWVPAVLQLACSRVLWIRAEGYQPQQVQVRQAEAIAVHPGRVLQLDVGGRVVALRMGTTDELERWHTLLTQMMMFRPGTCCALSGWLQRADGAAASSGGGGGGGGGAPWQYFELLTTGTALVYASPHRNKLGQALLAVALSQCAVAPDPKEPGTWLIRDADRDAAHWRASSLQASSRHETVESVLAAHVPGLGQRTGVAAE